MLQSVRELLGLRVRAKDGKAGKAADFYFDDGAWQVRAVIVNTGGRLSRHCVVLNPALFSQPEASQGELSLSMTCNQVRESPEPEAMETFERHEEELLERHYGGAGYRAETGALVGGLHGAAPEGAVELAESEEGETAETKGRLLHSAHDLLGYHVEAADGAAGELHDFLMGDDDWTIRHLVVDPKDPLRRGHLVLIPASWVDSISWPRSTVYLRFHRERVKNAQQYDVHAHSHLEKPARSRER